MRLELAGGQTLLDASKGQFGDQRVFPTVDRATGPACSGVVVLGHDSHKL